MPITHHEYTTKAMEASASNRDYEVRHNNCRLTLLDENETEQVKMFDFTIVITSFQLRPQMRKHFVLDPIPQKRSLWRYDHPTLYGDTMIFSRERSLKDVCCFLASTPRLGFIAQTRSLAVEGLIKLMVC